MRDFSWKVFTLTGDIDAYLLYKQTQSGGETEPDGEEETEAEEKPDDLLH